MYLDGSAGRALIFHAPGEFHAFSNLGTAPDLVVVSFRCDSPDMAYFRGPSRIIRRAAWIFIPEKYSITPPPVRAWNSFCSWLRPIRLS